EDQPLVHHIAARASAAADGLRQDADGVAAGCVGRAGSDARRADGGGDVAAGAARAALAADVGGNRQAEGDRIGAHAAARAATAADRLQHDAAGAAARGADVEILPADIHVAARTAMAARPAHRHGQGIQAGAGDRAARPAAAADRLRENAVGMQAARLDGGRRRAAEQDVAAIARRAAGAAYAESDPRVDIEHVAAVAAAAAAAVAAAQPRVVLVHVAAVAAAAADRLRQDAVRESARGPNGARLAGETRRAAVAAGRALTAHAEYPGRAAGIAAAAADRLRADPDRRVARSRDGAEILHRHPRAAGLDLAARIAADRDGAARRPGIAAAAGHRHGHDAGRAVAGGLDRAGIRHGNGAGVAADAAVTAHLDDQPVGHAARAASPGNRLCVEPVGEVSRGDDMPGLVDGHRARVAALATIAAGPAQHI